MAPAAGPLVTIVTPTYNHAPWIGACIESVLAQTYPHWEQVVIDDGSPDATPDAVAPYLADPRVRYLRQPNRGIWRLAETYNLALEQSRGDLVAILEGDDLWPPDKLAAQVPLFDDGTVGLAYGRTVIADRDGRPLADETARREQWVPPYASFAAASPVPFLRDLLLLRGNVGAVAVVFRRPALERVGGFWQPPYFPAVDYTTLLRVATDGRAAFLDRPLGVWRKHAGQTTDVLSLRYALGHTRAAVAHFQGLPDSVKAALRIAEEDIWRARHGYLADAYWGATRARLRAGEWDEARRAAWGTLWWGNAFRRLEGGVCLLASLAHVDPDPAVEWLAARRPAPFGGGA